MWLEKFDMAAGVAVTAAAAAGAAGAGEERARRRRRRSSLFLPNFETDSENGSRAAQQSLIAYTSIEYSSFLLPP
jgi:hypothetical protein